MSTPAFEISAGGRVMYAEPVAARARELFALDWPKKRIAEIVAREFGLPSVPTRNTVTAWVEPHKHARWIAKAEGKRRDRIRLCTVSVVQGADRSSEWKIERIHRLKAAGLSDNAIAAVMTLDFPRDGQLRGHQVYHALRGSMPRNWKRKVAA
jgi:hypothetical protein